MTAYTWCWAKCSTCQGFGLVHGMSGEPEDCRDCGGSGRERPRDECGRFLKQKVPVETRGEANNSGAEEGA